MVDSVADNAIKVNTIDLTGKITHSTVTVTNTTTYTKHAVTNAQAVQNGKCMAAQGTKDGNVLRAATIDLEPCPPMGGPAPPLAPPVVAAPSPPLELRPDSSNRFRAAQPEAD